MQKAIGFIACVSVMAASLYLFSGGDPSRILSAQTESSPADGYGSAARRMLDDARQLAKQGNVKEARRLAETAASLSADWQTGEQTPQQLLAELDRGFSLEPNSFDAASSGKWNTTAKRTPGSNPFSNGQSPAAADFGEAPLPENASVAMVNKRKADRLMAEAKQALQAGDIPVARARAMQARAMKNVTWGLWDEQPDQLLAQIDRAEGTETFFADGRTLNASSRGGESNAEQTYQQASALITQAREAMDAGKLQTALTLAQQADALQASYGLYEDTPANVIRELQHLSRAGAAPAMVFQTDEQFNGGSSAEETRARQLVGEARDALRQGRLSAAREKAEQAQNLNVAFTLMEDRPELVLSDVKHALDGNGATAFSTGGPVDMTPGDVPLPVPNSVVANSDDRKIVSVSNTQTDNPFVINPVGSNTIETETEAAVPQFPKISSVSQTSETSDMTPMAQSDPLEDATNALDVRFAKLRMEVMNSVFRAEKLKERNSEEALAVLQRTRETVEGAGLPEESTKALTSHLDRSEKSIQTWMEQRAPIIAMERRNEEIRAQIENDVENQIRIEQEFVDLTNQFNELMKQRRYAEAELVANKAKDLNPNLPQAVVMVEKSKLQKQIAFNERLREDKADGFLSAMNAVERAAIATDEDFSFGDNWAELTKRRSERYGSADARIRTPSELKIEKALNETISLHFHNVPLTDIVRHIAMTHGINVSLDTRALETEGLAVNQAISIDVDEITLRNALKHLLDQAGGLVFDIENGILVITNRLAQDTKYEPRVYPVADLVIPMDLQANDKALDVREMNGVGRSGGLGLYQLEDDLSVSIGSNGSPRTANRRSAQDGPDFSGLVDLLTSTVEPGSWMLDGGAGTAEGNENTLSLVIRQTPAVHEQITDLLSQLRRLQDIQVTVEVRFISVTDRFFERIGVDFDFGVQDTLGDPPGTPAFGSRQLTFPGSGGGAQGGNNNTGTDLRGGGTQGQQGQQGQQGTTTAGLFDPIQRVNAPRDDFNRTVVGLSSPDAFTEDYDIQFRQGSFELGVPDFGNFNPDAGIQVGMAILSDIEAFFFIQAAQADERANLLFAPKVTLFNGQNASITDQTQRPFVAGLIPVVGTGAVGFQPIISVIPEGIQLQVVAVVSADRRYVRLSLAPTFTSLLDLFTFSFASGGAGGGAIGGGQQGGQGGGFGGGGGGGFGGQGGGGFGGIGGGFGGGQGGGGQGGGFGGQQGGQQGQQGQAGVGGGTLTVQQPVISNITISTTVSVPDGGTVLLGGIKRLREGRNMAGVPILNKIPYVSRLFKNSGVGRETESIMMMVTPRIIIQEEEEELILGTSGTGL